MLKVKKNNGEVYYVLTEQERYFLASQEAKDLVQYKLNNIEKYIEKEDKGICFFTDKPIVHFNHAQKDKIEGWEFCVNKNDVIYNCLYVLNNDYYNDIEKEAKYFLMWRCGLDGGYIEIVGDYKDINGKIYSVENTKYNECEEWYFDKENNNMYKDEIAEEIELTEFNKEEIRQWFLR